MHKQMQSKIVIFIVLLILMVVTTACGGGSKQNSNEPLAGIENNPLEEHKNNNTDGVDADVTTSKNSAGNLNPLVTIEMENGGKIEVELYPDIAPNTVNSFVSLIKKGFYDGVIFHRVIPNFMIQGGDPMGMGIGGPGYMIKGEFSSNGFDNPLLHERGVLSMARTPMPDSAGSQFFIMVHDSPFLDGEYAAFGKVLNGMETVDAIVHADRDQSDKPLQNQTMKHVTVDTFGVDYPEPETITK